MTRRLNGISKSANWLGGSILLIAMLIAGCEKTPAAREDAANPPPAQPPTPVEWPAESWSKSPPAQWPQFVLTNETAFRGHTALHGASAFLFEAGNHRLYAATANHLLGENGGVKPEIGRPMLDSVLQGWRLFPRTQPAKKLTASGWASQSPAAPGNDWLILQLGELPKELPATPLHLRNTPVRVGETVYLIGVPYAEPDRAQNVYVGKVTARNARNTRFRYDITPPVDISGFSGAPIVDEHGLVVGVMTVWFEPKMQGEKMLEAGGEDATSIATIFNLP